MPTNKTAKATVKLPVIVATKPAKAAVSAKPSKPTKPAKAAVSVQPEARKPVDTVTPETDKRTERAERIAADRASASAFYAAFDANRASVPVKALSAFKPLGSTAHPVKRDPSVRQAAAICAAFAGAGVKLANGAKAARVFEHDGKRVCIENGAMRDAISSKLISVSGTSPEAEMLTLLNASAVIGLIGERVIKLAKLA